MNARIKIYGALGAVMVCGAGWLVYTADKEGVIDAAWMWSWVDDGYDSYDPPSATKERLAELQERTLSDMIYVPGGSFVMGDFEVDVEKTDGRIKKEMTGYSSPARDVTLDGYYISRFETTNYDYDLYSDANDLPLLPPENDGTGRREGRYPANLTWVQASAYCAWLGSITEQPVSLLTEAQWEYAARSRGLDVAFATDTGTILPEVNVDGTTFGNWAAYSPDLFPPSPLGIYNMSGYYSEWVSDRFDEGYSPPRNEHNPQGPKTGENNLARGGYDSFGSPPGPSTTQRVYTHTQVTARCAVQLSDPPSVSGFGRDAGKVPPNYPALISSKPFSPDWKPEDDGLVPVQRE